MILQNYSSSSTGRNRSATGNIISEFKPHAELTTLISHFNAIQSLVIHIQIITLIIIELYVTVITMHAVNYMRTVVDKQAILTGLLPVITNLNK
jgi:hypothetical protein